MHSLRQQQQQGGHPDSSPSLKLPLQFGSPPVWNGSELCGGKLSPMHLDCCLEDRCDGARANDRRAAPGNNRCSFSQNRTQTPVAVPTEQLESDQPARLSVSVAGGSSGQEAVIGSWPPLPPKGIRKKAAETLGFSAVAMEMLREQEDRDLHPFGRGGRFEGVLYSRRVKVQVDHTKFLAWIVFASFILLTSGAIIFLAEMERRQKSQQSLLTATTGSTIDGLLHNRNSTS